MAKYNFSAPDKLSGETLEPNAAYWPHQRVMCHFARDGDKDTVYQRVLNDLQRTMLSRRRMIWLLAPYLPPPLVSKFFSHSQSSCAPPVKLRRGLVLYKSFSTLCRLWSLISLVPFISRLEYIFISVHCTRRFSKRVRWSKNTTLILYLCSRKSANWRWHSVPLQRWNSWRKPRQKS